MAIQWGSWEYASGNGMRVGVDVTITPASPSTSDTQVSVERKWYVQNQYNYADSQTLTYGGDDSGSTNFTNNGGDNAVTLVSTRTTNVSISYGSTGSKTYSGTISDAYNGVTPSKSVNVTIPARPYEAPAAPGTPTVSRISDTSQSLSWVRNSTTAAPYESQEILRRKEGVGSWVQIATVSGTATSYTDTSTASNGEYYYFVRARNSAGVASSPASSAIYTTPANPSSCAATKTSGGDITVTWSNSAMGYAAYATEVYESQNGGAWTLLATVAGPGASYTHVSPSTAVTHAYRVRHKSTVGSALYSGYSTSGTVTLAAAPNAPTGLGPSTPYDATTARTLTWVHNPTDTSPQSKFQIRRRIAGNAWTEDAAITSSTSSWVLPASTYANGLTIEWEVRTWGAHANPSPYSATASFVTSAKPTANITSPADAGTVSESTVTVEWGYFDAEGTAQTAWRAELLNASAAVVETLTGSGAASSATFATSVGDGTSWTVRVSVADGTGLWSAAATSAFSVSYDLPPTPTITTAWDWATGTVTVEVTNPDTSVGEVDAVSVDLWRSIDAGPWVKVAQGFPLNSSIVDYAPTVAGSNLYRVDAVSALPSIATSAEVEAATPQAGDGVAALWLSAGPGFSQVCRGVGNVRRSAATDLVTRSVRRYAGRTKALEISGTQDVRTWQVALDYAAVSAVTHSTPDEWLAMGRQAGPFLLRNPEGLYVYVSASGMATQTDADGTVTGVSFVAVETEGPAETAYEGVAAITSIVDNGDGTFTITSATAAVLPAGAVTVAT